MAGETGSLACVSSDAKDRTSPGRILGRLLGGGWVASIPRVLGGEGRRFLGIAPR